VVRSYRGRPVADNGWLHCDADPDLVFGGDVEEKYLRALRKIAHFADGEQRFHAMVSMYFARS